MKMPAGNNIVVVQAQWTDGTAFASGNFQMVASGVLMSSNFVAIVTPFIDGQLDSAGSLSVPAGGAGTAGGGGPGTGVSLLASDNFGAGQLTWNFKIVVQGITDIVVADVPVNFALGATQGLFGLLTAAGWNPTPT
jgi:hypothetical protein